MSQAIFVSNSMKDRPVSEAKHQPMTTEPSKANKVSVAPMTRQRRAGLTIMLLGLFCAVLVVCFLMLPFNLTVHVSDPDGDVSEFSTTAVERMITIDGNAALPVYLKNPNYYPVTLTSYTAKIRYRDSKGRYLALVPKTSVIKLEKVKISAFSSRNVTLPLTFKYTADAAEDPIYRDFISRCYKKENGTLEAKYTFTFKASTPIGPRTIHANGKAKLECPIPAEDIKDTMDVVNLPHLLNQ